MGRVAARLLGPSISRYLGLSGTRWLGTPVAQCLGHSLDGQLQGKNQSLGGITQQYIDGSSWELGRPIAQ